MLYALMCTDKPDHLQMRMDNRPAHVAYLESLGDALKGAGPFLGEDQMPNGSLVIVDAPNPSAAQAIADGDPYAKAGLFGQVEIRPWVWKIKNPEDAEAGA